MNRQSDGRAMGGAERKPRESGFSLIELMIAMVVTLIVSGAVFGLLASGQNAFRREPELSDRQQNIRVAMDMIQRDIGRAGLNLPPWGQVFATPTDGGAGPDALEIMAGAEGCPPVMTCKFTSVAGTSAAYELPASQPPNSACPGMPRLVAVTPGPGAGSGAAARELFVIGLSSAPVSPVTTCIPALNPGLSGSAAGSLVGMTVTVPSNQGPAGGEWRPAGGTPLSSGNPQMVVPMDVVRYQIAPDAADPSDPTMPCLWRSTTGGRDPGDGYGAVQPIPGPAGTWQIVARGIEDMQVTYTSGSPSAPVTSTDAPVVVNGTYATLVFEVQVTLQARVSAQRLEGETQSALGPQRVRGQLTSSTAPRAALLALSKDAPGLPPGVGNSKWN